MKSILGSAILLLASLGAFQSAALAENRCDDAPEYFQPLIDGDGQRYPLTIGPMTWHLIGSGISSPCLRWADSFSVCDAIYEFLTAPGGY